MYRITNNDVVADSKSWLKCFDADKETNDFFHVNERYLNILVGNRNFVLFIFTRVCSEEVEHAKRTFR